MHKSSHSYRSRDDALRALLRCRPRPLSRARNASSAPSSFAAALRECADSIRQFVSPPVQLKHRAGAQASGIDILEVGRLELRDGEAALVVIIQLRRRLAQL